MVACQPDLKQRESDIIIREDLIYEIMKRTYLIRICGVTVKSLNATFQEKKRELQMLML
jgi:hypothetical protein